MMIRFCRKITQGKNYPIQLGCETPEKPIGKGLKGFWERSQRDDNDIMMTMTMMTI